MAFKNPNYKRALFLLIGVVASVFLLRQLQNTQERVVSPSIPYSDFVKLTRSGVVQEISISPASGIIVAKLVSATPATDVKLPKPLPEAPVSDPEPIPGPEPFGAPTPQAVPRPAGNSITTVVPPAAIESVLKLVEEASPSTVVQVATPEQPSPWGTIFFYSIMILPIILIIGIWYSTRRANNAMSGGDRGVGKFGKSQNSMVDPANNPIRLSDVAGCDEAKIEVAEIVDFLRRPEDFQRVGAEAPKGVLMVGPPGTGKTLMAKAIAGEAGVPFFTASGSDFVEMFVGVGAARVRSLFEQVKASAPAIVFIDEIDAVGKHRSGGNAPGSNDEREQTLNALLVEMDGFQPNSGVVVIAATNRADVLDAALRRPGRFDREVTIPLPDRAGRVKILTLHAKKVPVSKDVDWEKVARGTPGFSGADLANLVNEGALHAARRRAAMVTMADLDSAFDKILLGVERKGNLMNLRERTVVAYHEAGHAIVGHFLPHGDPVHKITIVPRGRSLGVTMSLPEEDSYNQDAQRLRTSIAVLLGGRAAEQVALNSSTVGASNDFHRATQIARRYVGVWGMSDLGTISIHGEEGENQWGQTGWSEEWKRRVDDTAVALIKEEYERAVATLVTNRAALERVAQSLLETETVDAEQFLALLKEPASVEAEVLDKTLDTEASPAL